MDDGELKNMDALFRHYMAILSEDFQHKLGIVAEGHQLLVEKIETAKSELKEEIRKVDHRLTLAEANLATKIEGITTELATHRHDAEGHRTPYGISERKE